MALIRLSAFVASITVLLFQSVTSFNAGTCDHGSDSRTISAFAASLIVPALAPSPGNWASSSKMLPLFYWLRSPSAQP